MAEEHDMNVIQPIVEALEAYKFTNPDEMERDQLLKLFYAFDTSCEQLYENHYSISVGEMLGSDKPPTEEYSVPPSSINRTIIPWTSPTISSSAATDVLRKVLLYSDLTVFVVPQDLYIWGLSYSWYGHWRDVEKNKAALHHLVSLNRKFQPLVNDGRVIFLPQSIKKDYETTSGYDSTLREAPYHQNMSNLNYLPLNITLPNIEDLVLYQTIVLPYFEGISMTDMLKIKQNETEAFHRFQHILQKKLFEVESTTKSQAIKEIFEEVNYEVQGLLIECQKISKLRVMQRANLGFFGVSLLALLFSNLDVVKEVASVIGSVSLLDAVKEWTSYKTATIDIKKNDFYIALLLQQKAKQKS